MQKPHPAFLLPVLVVRFVSDAFTARSWVEACKPISSLICRCSLCDGSCWRPHGRRHKGWMGAKNPCRSTSWHRIYEFTSGHRGPYVPIDKSLKPISCYSLLIFKRASQEHLVMRENMSDGLWSSVWSPAKHMLTLEQEGSERLEAEAKLDFIER